MRHSSRIRAAARAIAPVAFAALLLVIRSEARASDKAALDRYKEAVRLLEKDNFDAAIRELNAALRERAQSGIIRTGMFSDPYYPHFYLGRAYCEKEDWEAAVRELRAEVAQGAIQARKDLHERLQFYLKKAEKGLAASQGAPAPSGGATVADGAGAGKGGGPAPAGGAASPPPTQGTPSSGPANPPPSSTAPVPSAGSVGSAAPSPPPRSSPERAIVDPSASSGKASVDAGAGAVDGLDAVTRQGLRVSEALLQRRKSILRAGDERTLADLSEKLRGARRRNDAAEIKRIGADLAARGNKAAGDADKAVTALRSALDEAAAGRYQPAIDRLETTLREQPDNVLLHVVTASLYFSLAQQARPADPRKMEKAREHVAEAKRYKRDLRLLDRYFPPRFLELAAGVRPSA